MAKRTLEQTLVSLHSTPCKRWASEFPTSLSPGLPHSEPVGRRRKRKTESVGAARVPACSPCERGPQEDPPESPSPPPCKRRKVPQNPEPAAYKYQDDEIFPEFNSFQFWKAPLPNVDFSELECETCADSVNGDRIHSTEVTEDMDS